MEEHRPDDEELKFFEPEDFRSFDKTTHNRVNRTSKSVIALCLIPLLCAITYISLIIFWASSAAAASDVLYDFGVLQDNPNVSSTNPALLAHCGSQVVSGLSVRAIDFELADGSEINPGATQDKAYNSGSIYFGACQTLSRWLSYGVHVNANALSFQFKTQDRNNPLVFPYGKDTLPIGSGGIAVKVIEPLSLGFAWKLVEKIDVDLTVPVRPDLSFQTIIDVDIRPSISWLAGGSFRADDLLLGQDLEFYYSYAPEIRGTLNVGVDFPVDVAFVDFNLGLLRVTTPISYIPAQNRFGVLGQYQSIQFDLGVVQNQWSKFNDPFLKIDALANVDEFIFENSDLQLQDTFEPYLVLTKHFKPGGKILFGYSYRRNPVRDDPRNVPLVGADMHAFKFGAEKGFTLFRKQFNLGAEAVVGFMNGSESVNDTQSLTGQFVNFQTYIKIDLDE